LRGKIKEIVRNCFLELELLKKNPTRTKPKLTHPQPITGFSNWFTCGCFWVTLAPELNTTTGRLKFSGQTR
jgi:hypothetical protein